MEGLEVTHMSEEHLTIAVRRDDVALSPGDNVELIVNHGCTTINLHDRFYGVRDGKLEVIWDIAARGRSR